MSGPTPEESSGSFPTTEWTQIIRVIQAGADDAAWRALSEFCEQYRPAIYGFFRRRGCGHEQAENYTQDFFAKRILERWEEGDGFLFKAKRGEQRRFRSFLCHVLWAFLKDQWKAERTQKAGGGKIHEPLDNFDFADAGSEAEAFAAVCADLDREVGLEILKRAAGDSTRSQYMLKFFQVQGATSQAEAARGLGISENAFKKAFHEFKEKFRVHLRLEVGKLTGPNPKDIEDEIRYLMSIFSRSGS